MSHIGAAGAGLELDMFDHLLRSLAGLGLLRGLNAWSWRTGKFCRLLSLSGVGHGRHVLVRELEHGYRTSTSSKMLQIKGSSKMLQIKRSSNAATVSARLN